MKLFPLVIVLSYSISILTVFRISKFILIASIACRRISSIACLDWSLAALPSGRGMEYPELYVGSNGTNMLFVTGLEIKPAWLFSRLTGADGALPSAAGILTSSPLGFSLMALYFEGAPTGAVGAEQSGWPLLHRRLWYDG